MLGTIQKIDIYYGAESSIFFQVFPTNFNMSSQKMHSNPSKQQCKTQRKDSQQTKSAANDRISIVIVRKIGMVLVSFNGLVYLTICASFDALPYLRGWLKQCISLAMVVFLLFWAVHFEIMVPRDKDYVILINHKGSYVSFHSMLTGWFKVIGIFLVKQAINTVLSKGKCISIRYSPFIEWFDEQSHKNSNTTIQMAEKDSQNATDEIEIKQMQQRDDTDNFESVERSQTNSDDGYS